MIPEFVERGTTLTCMGTAESMGGLSIICDGRDGENNTAAIPFIDLNHRNLADNKFGVRRHQISGI